MKIQKIKLGGIEYTVKIAETEQEQSDGLMGVKKLPLDKGMLFKFKEQKVTEFWMKDTLIPLKIIWIDSKNKVTKIINGEVGSEKMLSGDGKYVLELNIEASVKLDDTLEFGEYIEMQDDKLYVIDNEGDIIMELDGNERIFSRKNTKVLIKFAKKADESKLDSDYKALGKRVFKFLDIQNSNEEDYV